MYTCVQNSSAGILRMSSRHQTPLALQSLEHRMHRMSMPGTFWHPPTLIHWHFCRSTTHMNNCAIHPVTLVAQGYTNVINDAGKRCSQTRETSKSPTTVKLWCACRWLSEEQ